MTAQSLFNCWYESSYIDNLAWVLGYHQRLNPAKSKVMGLVDQQTGAWDLHVADAIHSVVPQTEIIFRPYSPNENTEWKNVSPKQWIANAKARLQGRPYRVTFCCEPSPSAADLPAFLAYSVKLMEEADTQTQPVDMWAFQNQFFLMFTDDPRDITKGMWDTAIKVAGQLRGRVQIDYHGYTGLWLPAGAYDDAYLREVANTPDYLANPSTWFTYEQVTSKDRRYQTRHLFRHNWLNYRALEKGYQTHDYFLGEGVWDWYGGEDELVNTWARANAIAGDDLNVCPPNDRRVSGLRTLRNFFAWKRPDWSFLETAVHQLTWYGELLANDPRCKGWTLYAYTSKEGDQQPYNVSVYKDILNAMVGRNPVRQFAPPTTPAPQPVPTPPPVVTLPPVIPPLPERQWRAELPDDERTVLSLAKGGQLGAMERLILHMAHILDEETGHVGHEG